MPELYDIYELPEGTVTIAFDHINFYQRKDSLPTEFF